MGWVVPAMMAGSALMGMYGKKQDAKAANQPTRTNTQSQITPYDFMGGMGQGNSGADLLGGLLGGYGGLLGNTMSQFSQRPQGNPLQGMLSTLTSEFYNRRGQ